ncbi:MAG: protein translocase subunit SecF [Firmicutes bacterium]|nr:protein translocase subunit SecF [Bacillota bacterium]
MIYDLLEKVHFMKNRKIYYFITVALIVISIGVGLFRGFNFGIDFTGGTLLTFDMGQKVKISEVNSILSDEKLTGTVMYTGDKDEGIIIKTNEDLDSGKRQILMDAMKTQFGIDDDALLSVSNIGPSVGKTLRTSAAKAVAVAVLLMLIYIAIRFMWKYGIAAILALANTILLMIGFYGVFHVTINSPFIAAVLTILGYGINDTIVIFDRIRENTGGKDVAKRSLNGLDEKIDNSIRQTVGRSIMTSLTTIAVMVPLVAIGGTTIRSFILPILVGVIASTCSSIFIAPALWYDTMRLTDKNSPQYKAKQKEKREKKVEKEKAKKAAELEKERARKEQERQARLEEKKKKAEEKKKALEEKKAEKEKEQ